jgi:hypothetical protein
MQVCAGPVRRADPEADSGCRIGMWARVASCPVEDCCQHHLEPLEARRHRSETLPEHLTLSGSQTEAEAEAEAARQLQWHRASAQQRRAPPRSSRARAAHALGLTALRTACRSAWKARRSAPRSIAPDGFDHGDGLGLASAFGLRHADTSLGARAHGAFVAVRRDGAAAYAACTFFDGAQIVTPCLTRAQVCAQVAALLARGWVWMARVDAMVTCHGLGARTVDQPFWDPAATWTLPDRPT